LSETVNLKWRGPFHINDISLYDESFAQCLYAICRIWGGKESLLYIGRTKRQLRQRIKEHMYWLSDSKSIYIRFGCIELLPNQKWSDKRFADTESLLITALQPPENTQNSKYYCGRELDVVNRFKRGPIRKFISSDELLWG